MLEQISEANTKMTAEPIAPVIEYMIDLRETWSEAVTIANKERKLGNVDGLGGAM
jgi:flagellin-specific chaperone FliS